MTAAPYPVDSTTRGCCGGIGSHTPDCMGETTTQRGLEHLKQPIVGTLRVAHGFQIRVEGVERENGTFQRSIVVAAPSPETRLQPEAVRQVASALIAAADEIQVLR